MKGCADVTQLVCESMRSVPRGTSVGGCVLVGATSAGHVGGEVLGLLTLAVHAEVPTERLRHMIYAYPTFHRGMLDALADLTG